MSKHNLEKFVNKVVPITMSGEEHTPGSQAAALHCQFFVQRKKRYCRMTLKPGRHYCGEHEPQPRTEAGQTDKRIPCPNDPKHTCYESKLQKHLAICNARRTEQPPYIIENINAPEAVEICPRLPLNSYSKKVLGRVVTKVFNLYLSHVHGHITAESPSPIHRAVLPEFCEAGRAESSLRHLRQVSALLWCAERAPLPAPRACYVEPGAGKGHLSYYAAHAWCAGTGSRVLAVDRAPLRHKRDNKLRSAPPTVHHPGNTTSDQQDEADTKNTEAANVNSVTDNRSLSINNGTNLQKHSDNNGHSNPMSGSRIFNKPNENDRINDSEKHSADVASVGTKGNTDNSNVSGVMKDAEECSSDSGGSPIVEGESGVQGTGHEETGTERSVSEVVGEVAVRLRVDLAHLALEAVPVVAESAAVVGLAKHLCGVATDYALRCIAAPGVVRKTKGLVLATCCHHRIERAPYVGRQQLEKLGINAEDFNVMLGMVSWATCGDGRSRERRLTDQPRDAEAEEAERKQGSREEMGRRAKLLLDWGRVLWLRERGFDARLCYYVPWEVTRENVAIVAVKRRP